MKKPNDLQQQVDAMRAELQSKHDTIKGLREDIQRAQYGEACALRRVVEEETKQNVLMMALESLHTLIKRESHDR